MSDESTFRFPSLPEPVWRDAPLPVSASDAECDPAHAAASTRLNDTQPRLVLASKSPRRQELLRAMGMTFEVVESEIDEARLAADHPRTFALRAAYAKARAVAERIAPPALVIAADTIVTCQMRLFGKPRSRTDARSILRTLSGQTHQVITAIAVAEAGKPNALLDSQETRVRFRQLDNATLEAYLATDEPFDKAGAYGIQGRGGDLVERIDGDYFNVVGLPCDLLLRMLSQVMDVSGFRLPPAPERSWDDETKNGGTPRRPSLLPRFLDDDEEEPDESDEE